MTRAALVQRQIVTAAGLVVAALMLRAVLECAAHAEDWQYTGVPLEMWISLLLFAGMGVLVGRGLMHPGWISVTWVVIATVYFTVWSCWAEIAGPRRDSRKAAPQLTIPGKGPKTNPGFGGMGR